MKQLHKGMRIVRDHSFYVNKAENISLSPILKFSSEKKKVAEHYFSHKKNVKNTASVINSSHSLTESSGKKRSIFVEDKL